MMRHLLLVAAALAGCSDPPVSHTNPTTLWLAPDGGETHAKLVESEPPPW